MTTDALDLEFARFQRTRAPEALAAVFDAAAPRLVLVAMHLCRDAAAAEDLVQTVFLQAMRDVERWQPGRPVLPWLLGILEHRAHDHRSRAHRRREGAANDTAIIDPAPGPERLAVDAEVRQQVATAIAALPREYREVLTLRLVHGLRAIDIAHAQSVPPATVRTRLHRGLAMLRASLPRGLATPTLLALLAGEALRARDGLPAIKAALLRTLPQALPIAAAGAAATKWLLGLAAIAAAVLVYVGVLAPGAAPPSVATGRDGVVAASGEAAMQRERASDAIAGDNATAQRVLAPKSTAVDPATSIVRGRAIDAATNAPLAGATVKLSSYVDPRRGEAPADWNDLAPVTAGADGTFAFAFVPPPVFTFDVAVAAPGHVEVTRSLSSLRPGIAAELGDFALALGTCVRLHVEVDGRPAPGLEVNGNRFENGVAPTRMLYRGVTDANGELDFGCGTACPLGRWRYEVRAEVSGPRTGEFDVPLQAEPFVQRISLRRPTDARAIGGTLVDQTNAPVAGVELRVPAPGTRGVWSATTASDGGFLLAVRPEDVGTGTLSIELPRERTDLEWIGGRPEFVWGAADLRLVVRRRPSARLVLTVVDAAGAPLEQFGATCHPDPWELRTGEPNLLRVPPSRHEGGVCTFADLRPGPVRVSVFAPAPYGERADLPVVLAEGQTASLQVVFAPSAELAVEVVAAGTGVPLAGVELALAKVLPESHGKWVQPTTEHLDVDLVRRGGGTNGGTNVLTMARASTDAGGRARLRCAPGTPALVLFVEGPKCAAKLIRDVELPVGGTRLRVEVEPAALLRGIVQPREFVERCGTPPWSKPVEPWAIPESSAQDEPMLEVQLRDSGIPCVRVDEHGAFAFGALPAGHFEVWVRAKVPYGDHGLATVDLGPVTAVDLDPAQPRELELDLRAFVPGRVQAAVFVDGVPWTGKAGFARIVGDQRFEVIGDSDGRGNIGSPWLQPGRYVVFAQVKLESGTARPIYGTEPFVLAPGGELSITAALHRRAVAITVLDAQGKPIAPQRVVLQPLDHPELAEPWRDGARTDAAGRVTFDPAPPGRLRVCAFADGQQPGARGAEPALVLGELDGAQTAATLRWPQ